MLWFYSGIGFRPGVEADANSLEVPITVPFFCEFQGIMKRFLALSALLLTVFTTAWAQGNASRMTVAFPDSIQLVLNGMGSETARDVAAKFPNVWTGLDPGQRQQVQSQITQMKISGYQSKAYLLPYFVALVDAVTIEHTTSDVLTSYLTTAGNVIDLADAAKVLGFFSQATIFFAYHALHYDKTFRILIPEGTYTFDYLGLPTTNNVVTQGPAEDTTQNDPWANYDSMQDAQAYDTVPQPVMPAWMQPPPQPFIDGPVIKFTDVTFNFVTSYDSVFLRDTEGNFSFNGKMFVGKGGSFGWTPAGLSEDSVYCNFNDYHFNTDKPGFMAEMAMLNYSGRTNGKIAGQFEFQSQARPDSTWSTYPRFHSYENNLAIAGLAGDEGSYSGGFSLEGRKILSTDLNGGVATIRVTDSSGLRFKVKSNNFIFGDSTFAAERASLAIYHGNDSIVHPAVWIKYDWAKKFMIIQGAKGFMRNTPYAASFFNIDFSADKIKWDLKKDTMNIYTTGGRSTSPMIIESENYYDAEDFRLLRGQGFHFHPVALVAIYCLQNNTRDFYTGNLITTTGQKPEEIKMAVEFLSQKGLLTYNAATDQIHVNEKLIRIWEAYKGDADFDNLKIHSLIDTYPNATLSLQDGSMTVRGVDEFKVSDSLNVVVKPDSSVITILQNRDIKFNGTVTAGNFEITGKDFTLKYDSFFINLPTIDSINFFTMEKNARGQTVRKKLNNSMVGADSTAAAEGGLANTSQSSGTLYISKPNNKSGRDKYPDYPRLDATTGGVMYFDRREVLNGAYDRSVFFVVPPFKLDSLNDADPTSVNFDGTFVSNGMFPNFKEKLHTMPDKSLGFIHQIPTDGYHLYKTDAVGTGTITLNSKGLRLAGNVKYLAANVKSDDFVFYPDSVITQGSHTGLTEQQFGAVKFPQASFPDYKMKWYPRSDQMTFNSQGKPFSFYDSTAFFKGAVSIAKSGVSGKGNLETQTALLNSDEMSFTATDYSARHATFKAKSADPAKPLVAGTDVRVKYDLANNYADISPEVEGEAAIEFPYAQFKTSIPNARLDMNAQKIVMSKRPDVPIENSYFYTTRKDLDSLSFYAERAEYDLKTQQLKVSGIPYIIVADAKITPENNEVLILENAKIGTLRNTTIVLDTLNGYHRLTDGVVDIVSRKEFSGYATYQYVNLLKDTFAIKMTDFHLEPITPAPGTNQRNVKRTSNATMQTVATGSVDEKEKLVLGAGMYYKGEMTMYATRPSLQLDGYVKLDIKKIPNYDTWIHYTQTGDESDINIDFDNALSEGGKKVDAGLYYKASDNSLYITFISDPNEEDDAFFLPSGTLHYDTASHEFRIEDLDKAAGTKLSGKVFAYNDETSQVRFEGPVNMFSNTKDFQVTASAIGQGNIATNEISMNSFVMITPNMPQEIFNMMAMDLQKVVKNEGAQEGIGDETQLLYKISDIVGERAAKDYEQRSLQGYVSLATIPTTARPLVFADVDMKWSQDHKAFYSTGKLGLSNILHYDINGAFDGYMEVKKNPDGSQVFNVFFKASPDSWYYFGYEDGQMLVYSSVPEFNDLISKKTNAGKAKVGEMTFVPGSEEETLAFINRFRKEYLGIEVPYNLNEGATVQKKVNEQKQNQPDKNDGF